MAFVLPHGVRDPLRPRHRLALDVDAAAKIVRARDLAAYLDAEAAVQSAREQADAIVAEARAAFEAEQRRGHEEGTMRAKREESRRMAELVARSDTWLAQIEDRLAAVVMQAVRKIVHGYDERERVLQSLRSALAVVRNQKQITVRVHPGQLDHVHARIGELIAAYPGVGTLDVMPDARVAADSCILESEIGIVEAGTEAQLAALEAALRNARGGKG